MIQILSAALAVSMFASPPSASLEPTSSEPAPAPRLGVALSFAFEPRVGSYRDHDRSLEDYGYAPVASPLQLSYGLRGRVFTNSGWILGAAMSYGFRSTQIDTNPVPTTTTLFDIGFTGGHQLGLGLFATLDLGFSALSHSVGSSIDGGALVYLGPALAPRLGYVIVGSGPFLAVSVGYSAHFPIGRAHTQVLWEQGFSRPVIHAGLFAIESGFALGVRRWRWRGRGHKPASPSGAEQ